MSDIRTIFEIGMTAIIITIISGAIYLRKKYKEFRNNLQIDSAEYGASGYVNDVTHVLRSRIHSGRIKSFSVTNNTLGPKPIVGVPKTLIVRYKYRGEPRTILIREGRYLSIP